MISRILLGLAMGLTSGAAQDKPPAKPVDADSVALLPYPGTAVPGNFGFSPDGRFLSFLKSEDRDLSRSLWRTPVSADGHPKVVVSPPRSSASETGLSLEEKLRRERQRVRETGIGPLVRASKADAGVYLLGGDLYLLEGNGPPRRLTDTPEPEIDPKPNFDASKVAFVRSDELVVLDVDSGQETTLTSGSRDGLSHALAEFIAQEELDRQTGYWWSPDGSKIAYQETDERHIPEFTIVHQGDDEPSAETHRYPFSGQPNAKVRLGIVPVEGGETRWLDLSPYGEDAYLARVDWSGPDALLVQVLSRDQKSLKLVHVDARTGETSLFLEENSDFWINLHDDLCLLKTGEFVWASERSGFKHLELRCQKGQLVRTLTSGEWPVDSVVGVDDKRREVWFLAGKESPLGSALYRLSLEGGEPERITPEPGIHKVSLAPDCNHFVDVWSDLGHPPKTVLRDRSGSVLQTLDNASDDPSVREYALQPPRLAKFQDRDGITLHGAYYKPRNLTPGKMAPLVVLVYGGPHVQRVTNSWDLTADLNAQFLAERGFAVWKCDNRGSSRRGMAFEAAINRHMGEVEVRDQVDGVKFVGANFPEVDTAHVGISGGSYGGYMTLRCLMLAPDVFDSGAAIAPVTDWDGYDTGYTERYMGTPEDNPEGYRASSVLPIADRLEGDLLIIHGLIDENVHFRHSARLAKALIAADKPFELFTVPDERHSSRGLDSRRYVAEKTARFFGKTLKHQEDCKALAPEKKEASGGREPPV